MGRNMLFDQRMIKLMGFDKCVRKCKSLVPQLYRRFFDNQVFFEALYLIDNEKSIVKISFCRIAYPTTSRELKSFAEKITDLLKWKQATTSSAIERESEK